MRQPGSKNAKAYVGPSPAWIVTTSLVAAVFIASSALLLQWIIYDDWLREHHPFHYVGTILAAILGFVLVYRSQVLVRERQIETLHRFETVARMNDRIRNALQIIDCAAYVSRPEAADQVRQAVDVIDGVLREVLVNVGGAAEASSGKPSSAPLLSPEAHSAEH